MGLLSRAHEIKTARLPKPAYFAKEYSRFLVQIKRASTMKRLYFSLSIIITILALALTGTQPAQANFETTISRGTTIGLFADLGDLSFILEYRQNNVIGRWTPAFDRGLTAFIEQVRDERSTRGTKSAIRGIYIRDVLSMPVVQQPGGNAGWVSESDNTITQFGMATQYNTTGLLAHNTHAGAEFAKLQKGQVVSVVSGDGTVSRYKIEAVYQFQALQPTNPYSNFVDLETNQQLTATELFYRVYTGAHHLTFQTCIEKDGEYSWGRLFVLAYPLQ